MRLVIPAGTFTRGLEVVFDALEIRGRCLLCRHGGLHASSLCPYCTAALPRSARRCSTCLREDVGPNVDEAATNPCLACRREPPPWSRLVAPYRFEPPMSFLVPRIKKARGLIETSMMVSLVVPSLEREYGKSPIPEALVPVPMTRRRKLLRSFNHSEQLARIYRQVTNIPVARSALRRRKGGAPQRHLSRSARLRNVRGAFVAGETAASFSHVALVDDVMTTGATARAAASALTRAGVDQVDVWVTAYTPPR